MFKPFSRLLALALCCTLATASLSAQAANPGTPTHFPYIFSNFVWWTDPELRTLLKHRIPSLGDELVPGSPSEAKVRTALTKLLEDKNIHAIVQSFDPSPVQNTGALPFGISPGRAPGAPPPSIVFSILDPPNILIEKIVLEDPPPDLGGYFNEIADHLKGKSYAANQLWIQQVQFTDKLQQLGYLSATVTLSPGQPNHDGENYLLPLNVAIDSGPKYYVASVEADGGPLLPGRDLSAYYSLSKGDVATPNAFARLAGSLRSVYWQAGYTDVAFDSSPILDTARALAFYRFRVISGPLYHLRSLTIKNLNPTQQQEVQGALGLKPGDVFNALAVTQLNEKLSRPEYNLKEYYFGYTPREDKVANTIDLILEFHKKPQDP
jgi:hypothetical protein